MRISEAEGLRGLIGEEDWLHSQDGQVRLHAEMGLVRGRVRVGTRSVQGVCFPSIFLKHIKDFS